MTYAQVRAAYFEESFDMYAATQEQIDRLCDEVGDDTPQMRWDDYQEEMRSLMADLFA